MKEEKFGGSELNEENFFERRITKYRSSTSAIRYHLRAQIMQFTSTETLMHWWIFKILCFYFW